MVVEFKYKVGDVVAFHPNTLHGGATSQPGKPRRTLAFRMFGDDVVRIDYPGVVKRDGGNEENYMGKFEQLEVGVNLSEAMSLTIRPWISEK